MLLNVFSICLCFVLCMTAKAFIVKPAMSRITFHQTPTKVDSLRAGSFELHAKDKKADTVATDEKGPSPFDAITKAGLAGTSHFLIE